MPDRPGAWLLTTARRKAIDRLRREAKRGDKQAAAQELLVAGEDNDITISDDRLRRGLGPYQLQAAIAALYRELVQLDDSPVVALNRAVLQPVLDDMHLFHSTRADLLRRLDRNEEAAVAYERAIELTSNQAERSFLERRLAGVRGSTQ